MTNVKNYFTKQPQQIVSALILTGILSLSTGITLIESATAASRDIFLDATKSDGRRSSWVYHTDYAGRFLRLEAQTSTNLPKSVADAVLQDASRRSRLPISNLRIVKAERRQWPDGCLGISRPGLLCTAVIVPGWLVTVEAGQQRLVYRTGDFGSGVVFDQAVSKIR